MHGCGGEKASSRAEIAATRGASPSATASAKLPFLQRGSLAGFLLGSQSQNAACRRPVQTCLLVSRSEMLCEWPVYTKPVIHGCPRERRLRPRAGHSGFLPRRRMNECQLLRTAACQPMPKSPRPARSSCRASSGFKIIGARCARRLPHARRGVPAARARSQPSAKLYILRSAA
jgi:hypothetical protein